MQTENKIIKNNIRDILTNENEIQYCINNMVEKLTIQNQNDIQNLQKNLR